MKEYFREMDETVIKSEPCEPPTSTSPKSTPSSTYRISDILSSPARPDISVLGPASSLFQPFLQHLAVAAVASARALPFSIDNILKPGFGGNPPSCSSSSSSVKSEVGCPVDLSGSSNENEAHSKTISGEEREEEDSPRKDESDVPPGMVRGPNGQLWPAWVFCTRYSDRPSSGPRLRKVKKSELAAAIPRAPRNNTEKRPRTAFSTDQLSRLKKEFDENRYLTEERRRNLASELGLDETQIKIWFQNKRAKIKKSSGQKGELAQMLAAQGLYNHSTVPIDEEESLLFE